MRNPRGNRPPQCTIRRVDAQSQNHLQNVIDSPSKEGAGSLNHYFHAHSMGLEDHKLPFRKATLRELYILTAYAATYLSWWESFLNWR
jgi:hypothetical protein